MRGFLVKKKLVRYIVLPIYYQSFCDKTQDLLFWYVRAKVFQLLKNKLLNKNLFQKNQNKKRGSKENPVYPNKRKNKIDNRATNPKINENHSS